MLNLLHFVLPPKAVRVVDNSTRDCSQYLQTVQSYDNRDVQGDGSNS